MEKEDSLPSVLPHKQSSASIQHSKKAQSSLSALSQMCITVFHWQGHPSVDLLLLFNRDEYLARCSPAFVKPTEKAWTLHRIKSRSIAQADQRAALVARPARRAGGPGRRGPRHLAGRDAPGPGGLPHQLQGGEAELLVTAQSRTQDQSSPA